MHTIPPLRVYVLISSVGIIRHPEMFFQKISLGLRRNSIVRIMT